MRIVNVFPIVKQGIEMESLVFIKTWLNKLCLCCALWPLQKLSMCFFDYVMNILLTGFNVQCLTSSLLKKERVRSAAGRSSEQKPRSPPSSSSSTGFTLGRPQAPDTARASEGDEPHSLG